MKECMIQPCFINDLRHSRMSCYRHPSYATTRCEIDNTPGNQQVLIIESNNLNADSPTMTTFTPFVNRTPAIKAPMTMSPIADVGSTALPMASRNTSGLGINMKPHSNPGEVKLITNPQDFPGAIIATESKNPKLAKRKRDSLHVVSAAINPDDLPRFSFLHLLCGSWRNVTISTGGTQTSKEEAKSEICIVITNTNRPREDKKRNLTNTLDLMEFTTSAVSKVPSPMTAKRFVSNESMKLARLWEVLLPTISTMIPLARVSKIPRKENPRTLNPIVSTVGASHIKPTLLINGSKRYNERNRKMPLVSRE
mmetsp:Transcript_5506/g.10727  ORF Transcript_5506/g.10727 Transcript_5506/m.10727 type:complete len:310 (-) Transcript_5506:1320-2249(-)